MVELKPYGHGARAGEYICADCGYIITLQSVSLLPICPAHEREQHMKDGWRVLYGRTTVLGEVAASDACGRSPDRAERN